MAGRGSVTLVDPSADRDVPLKTLLRWSETISGIARTGLGFTESLYEKERFEEILKVAADIRTEADGADEDPDYSGGLVQEWMDTVGKGVPGYVTPKVAVGAAVGNDKGELLLIQRADSGIWLYPTGWCDVGWFTRETLPQPLVGSDRWGEHVFAAINGERRDVLYDSVRQPMWRGESTTS